VNQLWIDEVDDISSPWLTHLIFRCGGCDRRFWEQAERTSLEAWLNIMVVTEGNRASLGDLYPGTESGLKVALESSMCGRCWSAYTDRPMPPSQYLDPPPGEDS